MSSKSVTKRKRKSKIELAGDTVVQHIIEMAKTTDLSCNSMASHINKTYPGLNLNKMDISRFFKHNAECVQEIARDKSALSILRADIFLEHNAVMVKDIKILDQEIDKVLSENVDVNKRALTIANLVDKKGQLLLRHARLSGKLDDKSTNIHKMTQVNVFNKGEDEKSEIIQRLKQFSPHKTTKTPPKIPIKEEIVIEAEVISKTDESEEEMMILEEV